MRMGYVCCVSRASVKPSCCFRIVTMREESIVDAEHLC